ncbi:MAG: DUF1697 domain-containing protein [Methanobacterium sp.]|uniref:DUF1697 domain-containing protein n=1 Tax=Methanobacterium sp. TaxID=2164 RepID=UPI003D6527FA|nr:DUF1697 domain-containing protein [Methanobacterium sp.]
MRYIALLRGINVGRKNRIKMADLINIFESMGFKDVKTYLQSGNVIFNHDSIDTVKTARDIEKNITQTFGFEVNLIIRNEDELENIINGNPFIKESNIEIDKLHVTFLQERPETEIIQNLDINKDINEKFEVIDKEVYLYCPNGYARTKLTNNVFEKKLKTKATTRNWKTTNKLLQISKNK